MSSKDGTGDGLLLKECLQKKYVISHMIVTYIIRCSVSPYLAARSL